MGLTKKNIGISVLGDGFKIDKIEDSDKIIALGGNPNVGKSTVFNSLTGLKQHTGNWPGKTVANARGEYKYKDNRFIVVDLPGAYSLMSSSLEEEIARDFICFARPDATVIVADATCLERNLNFILQTMEITDKVIVCVNLIDEAKRKKINIDTAKLSQILKIPVIATVARKKRGLNNLPQTVYDVCNNQIHNTSYQVRYDQALEGALEKLLPAVKETALNKLNSRWIALKLLENDEKLIKSLNTYLGVDIANNKKLQQAVNQALDYLESQGVGRENIRDKIVAGLFAAAEEIYAQTVQTKNKEYNLMDRKIDKILTSKKFGIPVMLALLGFILWLTIAGANFPSNMLSRFFAFLETKLLYLFELMNSPDWVTGIAVLGVYRTLSWVVSVMLPPMAIFFPLFTLLEDLGYLPRVAFNLDNFFKKSKAHGKQALTMCMGFGCNAAGVIGCRIIESPRERLIAILTNNFVPCNGRFPILTAVISMFFAGVFVPALQSLISALILTAVILLGVFMTLLVSRLLSATVLKGMPSNFTLELPPYRKPQIGRIIVRSIFDRTLFVLGRAVAVAIPAGMVIWLMANINVDGISLLKHCADFLQPFAYWLGMDGYILMAFVLGFPANEIVIPIIIMSYLSAGTLTEAAGLEQLRALLVSNGWTWITAVCVMLFTLMHWPCGTTCLTVKKETQSAKWTLAAFLIPTVTGMLCCFVFANVARLFTAI